MFADKRQLFFALGIVTTATVAVVGYTYFRREEDPNFSLPIWTELYRSLVYTEKEQNLLLKFDQFSHASRLLQNEIDIAEKSLQPYQQECLDGVKVGSQQFLSLKKQMLELSCDIDHIFGKLDIIDLSNAVGLRAQRKQLVDVFAAKAKQIDGLIQAIELIENQHQ
jgi:hypothetical protein